MRNRRSGLARSAPLLAIVGVLALVGVSCANQPPPPTQTVSFFSLADGHVHIDVFVPGDPDADPPTVDTTVPVDVDLTGTAHGTWVKKGAGAFNVSLDMDAGSFAIDTDIGTIEVVYSLNSTATGSGQFNPSTGIGGFNTTLTLTVDEIIGLGPVGQPCDTGLQMSLNGQIDSGTGMLSVSQNGFTVLTPGDSDCGGLGPIFADLLGGPDNSATLGFRVTA